MRPLIRPPRKLALRLLVSGGAAAAAGAFALAPASGSTPPRLESARIAGGRDSVQVVARFSGRDVPAGIVMTTDANLYDDFG